MSIIKYGFGEIEAAAGDIPSTSGLAVFFTQQ